MRARDKRQKTRAKRAALVLTPLIDVIFLIALFFVINTSFRQEQYMDVVLPESSTSQDIQAEGLILTLRADGTSDLNGQDIPWESISSALQKHRSENGATQVIIRGDESIAYQRIVEAMDRVRLAGVELISLQTLRNNQ